MADFARADMARPRRSFSRGFGNLALQAALLVIVVGLAVAAAHNAAQNLAPISPTVLASGTTPPASTSARR
jgi:hypothetical protein